MHSTQIVSATSAWQENGDSDRESRLWSRRATAASGPMFFIRLKNPVEEPVIINPRGFRPYVRNDVFFKAIPLVLEKQPDAKFIFA